MARAPCQRLWRHKAAALCLIALLALHFVPTEAQTPAPEATPVLTPAATAAPTAKATPAPPTTTAAPVATTKPVATTPAPAAETPAPEEEETPAPAPVSTTPSPTPKATKSPTPAPTQTPSPTPRAPNPPAPPAPYSQPLAKTAVEATIRVIGSGVTPFNTDKQTRFVSSLGSALTTVPAANIRVILVSSAYSLRRKMLQTVAPAASTDGNYTTSDTPLQDVADVTLELYAGSTDKVAGVQDELSAVVSNGTLGTAMQANGLKGWGVQLLKMSAVVPLGAQAPSTACKKKWAAICLDGTNLSAGQVKGIIAGCVIGVVCLVALVWCVMDVRRKSGKPGQCEYAPETPSDIGGNTPVVKGKAEKQTDSPQHATISTAPHPPTARQGPPTARQQIQMTSLETQV